MDKFAECRHEEKRYGLVRISLDDIMPARYAGIALTGAHLQTLLSNKSGPELPKGRPE